MGKFDQEFKAHRKLRLAAERLVQTVDAADEAGIAKAVSAVMDAYGARKAVRKRGR